MSSLLEVYKDPKRTSRNPETLAKRAGVTVAAAKSFLRDREEAQVRKRAARLRNATYTPTGDERGVWLGDTIYLKDYAGVNKGRSAIFTLMEVNSRYVYARALTAPTSAQTAAALEDMFVENADEKIVAPILKLRTDGGPEFAGAFSALLTRRGVEHEKTGAGTHERLARLDRFHGTLRRIIGEMFAIQGSHEWVDALPNIIANYNSRPNRGLKAAGTKLAPEDIGDKEETLLRLDDLHRAKAVRDEVDERGVMPGTRVRLLYARTKAGSKDKFAKSHSAVWTTEIYDVVSRAGPNSFIVDVPRGEVPVWPLHSLQVVGKVLRSASPEGPRVDKKVVRAQRMEARNISEAEVNEALAAPARERRERAPRVDYKKLASGKQ
jgi:hypothetical protein